MALDPLSLKKKTVPQSAGAAGASLEKEKPGAPFVKGQDLNLTPHLPGELIGGYVPLIPGTEDEAVWNAASQACGTERVHYTYTTEENKIWYIACPSSALASHPDSWCPLAAALPGNSEYWDKETVYLYEKEGFASALRWDPDTGRMQVYLGASRTLLPRIQSMDANFVTINTDTATVVPWRNRALRIEKLSRSMVKMLALSGILLTTGILIFLFLQYLMINTMERNLVTIEDATQNASLQLLLDANNVMQSDALKHIVRIQELLDTLRTIDGTLVRYEVDGGKLEWEALVPQAYSGGVEGFQGEVQPGLERDGRVRIKGTR